MATYYVRTTGNNANSGLSPAAAKLTIQAAVNLATSAGDIVYVGAGSYRETVTLAASGSAGNVISLIGDYAGTQTGDAGVVRITGSNDDITATRSNCIAATSRSYYTISGFTLDMSTSTVVSLSACANITAKRLHIRPTSNGTVGIMSAGAGQSGLTVSECVFFPSTSSFGMQIYHTATVDNAGHAVSNCIFMGGSTALYVEKVGGITFRNCYVANQSDRGVRVGVALSVGQTLTVNNCVFYTVGGAVLNATTTAELVEDYNSIFSCAARATVNTGANSNTRPQLMDTRWFHSMVAGGTIVSPFDPASYSTLVELNSGASAPSTDLRGASVKGSYREWGPLEYNSALSVSGGSALGLPIVGSAIVRGDA